MSKYPELPYLYAGGNSWKGMKNLMEGGTRDIDPDLWDDLKQFWKENSDAEGWPQIGLDVDGVDYTFKLPYPGSRFVFLVTNDYVHDHGYYAHAQGELAKAAMAMDAAGKPVSDKIPIEEPKSLKRVMAETGAISFSDLMAARDAAMGRFTPSELANLVVEKAREDARRAREKGEDDFVDLKDYVAEIAQRKGAAVKAAAAGGGAAAAAPAPPRPHAFAAREAREAAEAKAAAAGGGAAAAPAKAPVKSEYQLMKEAKAAKRKEAKKAGWTFGQQHRVDNQAEYESLLNKMLEHGEIDKTLHQQAMRRKYNFNSYYLVIKKAIKNLRVGIAEKGDEQS